MKKLFIVLIVLLLSVSVVIGCGTPAPTTPAQPATPATSVAPTAATWAPPATTAKPTTPTTAPATKTTAAPKGPVYGGVLRFIEPTAPPGAIGAPWESPFGHPAQQVVEEAWIRYLADGTFIPWLSSFTTNSDPKNPSITWKFRKGIKFHDGTDLNAQVVKWSWDIHAKTGLFASVRRHTGCDILDDYTVITPMIEWSNSQFFAFSANEKYIVSPTYYEKNGLEAIRFFMVGTGPFKQVKFLKDVSLETVRFDNYWQTGKPYLQGVTYLFVADELTRLALFKTGGAEIMNLAGNGRIAQELQQQGWNIAVQASGCQTLLPDSANADSPWSNLKVRQAAEYALDKEAIAKAFGFGFFTAATQVPSPAAPAYIKDLPVRKYDPEKAKALLKEAGFPSGFKTKIIAPSAANRDVCVAVQSQYKAVGIECDLDFVEPLRFTEYQSKGWKNGLLFFAWGMEGNPVPSIGFNFPVPRTGRYLNVKDPPNWEKVGTAATTSPQVEPKLLQGYTQEVYNDSMVIPIYWTNALYAVSRKVQDHNLGKYAIGAWSSWDCWLSK